MRELHSALCKMPHRTLMDKIWKKFVPRECSSCKNDCYRSFPLYRPLKTHKFNLIFHISCFACHSDMWSFGMSFCCCPLFHNFDCYSQWTVFFCVCADSCFVRSFFLVFLIGIDLIFWTSLNTHFKSFNIWIGLCVVYFRISCNIGLYFFFTKKKMATCLY